MNASNAASAPEKFRFGMLPSLLQATWLEWQEDKVARLSAAFAYYTIFSIAPLLIIAITIAATILGEKAASGQIHAQIQDTVGADAAKTIEDMINAASKARGTGVQASIIGILVSLWGASNLFGQLQDSLNTIWEVVPKPSEGLWTMVRQRFLSFTMVLSLGFVLLVSLTASAIATSFGTYVSGLIGIPPISLQIINFVVALLSTTLFFALVYKLLPDAEVQWRDVWVGALMTAILFGVGRLLLALWLGRSGTSSAYGAAGSLVVMLLWVYYAAQILFFGAEFTQVFANRFGSKVVPSAHALPATDAMREQQGLPRLGELQATEVAQQAIREGHQIRNSEPIHAQKNQLGKLQAPAQVLARALGKGQEPAPGSNPGSSKPAVAKADKDYLLGALLGFAAILLLARRRDE